MADNVWKIAFNGTKYEFQIDDTILETKQDKLPDAIKDYYLHSNANTWALEWSEVHWWWGGWDWDMKYSDFAMPTNAESWTWDDISLSKLRLNYELIWEHDYVSLSSDSQFAKPWQEIVLKLKNLNDRVMTIGCWAYVTNDQWYNMEIQPNRVRFITLLCLWTQEDHHYEVVWSSWTWIRDFLTQAQYDALTVKNDNIDHYIFIDSEETSTMESTKYITITFNNQKTRTIQDEFCTTKTIALWNFDWELNWFVEVQVADGTLTITSSALETWVFTLRLCKSTWTTVDY